MRHSFKFPIHIREIVKDHINKAIDKTDPKRYNQESPYISALLAKLEGKIYEDKDYYIEIITTVMDDRGKNSAEHRSGADFSITAKISDKEKNIEKAILVQAKMDDKQLKGKLLKEQISKMRKITKSPKVLVINPIGERRDPYVCSGNKIFKNEEFSREKLANYFTKRVMTTFDGDTRKEFVEKIQNSNLPNLHLIIKEN